MAETEATKVVIIGGGFGGLSAARALNKSGAEVTLVDRNIYSTFQPLLYQVATGGLNPGDVAYPIRSYTRKRTTRFRRGEVTSIDLDARTIHLGHDGETLGYDYLIIASGAGVNYFGVPGAAENTVSLYRRADAIAVRDRLFAALENMAADDKEDLAVVLIGGGATGVELAGTLAELFNAGLGTVYPEIKRSALRVVLLEQGDHLLATFEPKLRQYALDQLRRRGVDVRLSTTVTKVDANEVEIGDGSRIPTALTVWTAGIGVNDWGLARGHGGRTLVGEDLRAKGQERVLAIGDVAISDTVPIAQLAAPAIQMGRHAGKQIGSLMAGQPTKAFKYRDKGTMATIGRRAAVVQFSKHVRLRGTLAWLSWIGLHVVMLLGGRNRISTLLNLSWRYVAWPYGNGVIVGDIPEAS